MKILLFAVLAISSSAYSHPRQARVVGAEAIGNGCGVNESNTIITEDGQALTIVFTSFQASIGADESAQGYFRRFCRVNLDIFAPADWSFGILGVDYRGYVSLERSVQARHWLAYGFGTNTKAFEIQNFLGPDDGDYFHSVLLPTTRDVQYSPCSRSGQLTRLKLHNVIDIRGPRQASGYIGVDSLDGEFNQPLKLKIVWQQCR